MSVAHLLTVLENDEFIERIQNDQKRSLERLAQSAQRIYLFRQLTVYQSFSLKRIKGKLLYSYRVNKSLSGIFHTTACFEQKQVDLEPPFLYLSVLQAFSNKQGSVSIKKNSELFYLPSRAIEKRLLLPIEETQERIEVLFWPDTQILVQNHFLICVFYNNVNRLPC